MVFRTLFEIIDAVHQLPSFRLKPGHVLFIGRDFKLLVYHAFFQTVYFPFDFHKLFQFHLFLFFTVVQFLVEFIFHVGDYPVNIVLPQIQKTHHSLVFLMQELAGDIYVAVLDTTVINVFFLVALTPSGGHLTPTAWALQ
ncbi:hypothetical protein [Sphingobacterium kyonggiense]|uniref:hypothetical protein n=1 Tax=Sphingobacterium kyonggiense TaxID=714075 RepID=UPI0031E416BE